MKREYRSWYSDRLQREMNIRVYGHTGTPLLILPTQDSMCDNFENFGMIDTVAPEIEAGKIQLFAVDTVDRETWSNVWGDKGWRAARQEDYYNYLIEEVLPFIRTENGKSYVMARGDNGRLEKRWVQTGRDLWGSYTQIRGGLSLEDYVAFPYGKDVREGAATVEANADELYNGL